MGRILNIFKFSWSIFHAPPPPTLNACKIFMAHPRMSGTFSQPTAIIQWYHSIDTHIWGRIIQDFFAAAPVNLEMFGGPPKFFKISQGPPPLATIVYNLSMYVLFYVIVNIRSMQLAVALSMDHTLHLV